MPMGYCEVVGIGDGKPSNDMGVKLMQQQHHVVTGEMKKSRLCVVWLTESGARNNQNKMDHLGINTQT